jgi:hypothetical protein
LSNSTTQELLTACPNCGCTDLFIRKDFPQKLGLAIVIIAALTFLVLASRPRWFYLGAAVLVAAVVIDALAYLLVGRVTVCYRCRTEFRNIPVNPQHGGFELATAEKYRTH